MARGFESKDVEFQQAEAERRLTTSSRTSSVRATPDARYRTIELSLARARSELAGAVQPAHRKMLEQAIDDLERQLAAPPAHHER